jgi:hypothetical protein
MTQVITSLFAKLLVVYVVLFVPTLLPFFFHWYAGDDPPFVGVAVKVTLLPEHMLEAETPMATLGVKLGLTVMVMLFEVAVLAVWHVLLAVITQLTTSPFTKALLE